MLALKQYELSNHLGNVLATVLDRRTMTSDKVLAYQTTFTGTTDGWTAGWSAAGTIYSATPPTTVAQNSNRLQCTATVSMGGIRKVIATTIGTAYTLTMDIDMGTAEGLYIMPRTTNGSNEFTGTNLAQVYLTSSGTYAVNFTATTSTTQLLVEKAGSVAQTFYIDNVKVEQSTPTLNSYPIADVVNAQYYYPFGSPMKTWKADGNDYRFGFGGMEKNDEIRGTGNSYTAEFWDYDARTGRRNNPDPVIKPYISSYATYSDDPINRIDPNGADDFYDRNGQLIKRTPLGNNIYVVNSSKKVFDLIYSSMMKKMDSESIDWTRVNNALAFYATPLPKLPVNENKQAVINIIWKYYLDLGYDPNKVEQFGLVDMDACGCTAQSSGPPETYEFATSNNRMLNYVRNASDIKSLWIHEYYHRQLQNGFTENDATQKGRAVHLQAYYSEVTNAVFASVSSEYRNHTINNIKTYLAGVSEDDAKTWQPKFEEALNGKFAKNKDGKYEFTLNTK